MLLVGFQVSSVATLGAMVKQCGSSSDTRPKIILPKLTKTGSESKDSQRASQRNLLLNLIEACIDDDSHIVPLYDLLLQRQRAKPVIAKATDFSVLSTVYAKCYEDFLSSWLVSVSDFNLAISGSSWLAVPPQLSVVGNLS